MGDRFEGLHGASGRGPYSCILIAIKQSLEQGKKGIPDAIAGLDLAIDSLFTHTDFHKMDRKFYQRTIEGNLKSNQEEKLRELGVRI